MNNEKYLGKNVKVVIDRPLGSKHPKHGFIYPINYGYVPNTISGDGEELDVFLLGEYNPVNEAAGKCIAIIHRTNDDDDKLVVSVNGKNYSDEEINALVEFQERWFEHIIIRGEEENTDEDIIDGLINGYNPFTGELFDEDHILNDPRVKKILGRIKIYDKFSVDYTYDDLNAAKQGLFDKLREWRVDTMYKEGLNAAYLIFDDKTLINIVCANILEKKDLLRVSGIGTIKYQKYGDEIYNIIKGE